MAELKVREIRRQLREMTDTQLHQEIAACRAALYDYRCRNAMGQLENTAVIGSTRKHIARAFTILREREITRSKNNGSDNNHRNGRSYSLFPSQSAEEGQEEPLQHKVRAKDQTSAKPPQSSLLNDLTLSPNQEHIEPVVKKPVKKAGRLDKEPRQAIKIQAASLHRQHTLEGRVQLYSRYIELFRSREVAAFLDAQSVILGNVFVAHYSFHWTTGLTAFQFLRCARNFLNDMQSPQCAQNHNKALMEGVYLVTLDRQMARDRLPLDHLKKAGDAAIKELPLTDLRSIKVATACADLFYELDQTAMSPVDIYRAGILSHQEQVEWLAGWHSMTYTGVAGHKMDDTERLELMQACMQIYTEFRCEPQMTQQATD